MTKIIRQVALFRAINVGGSNVIPMPKLVQFGNDFRFENIKTVLQSGNMTFSHTEIVSENTFESELAVKLHVQTDIMIRSVHEWGEIIESNPFKSMATTDPSHLLVMFLKDIPPTGNIDMLRDAIVGREEIQLRGKHLYITYVDGIGKSKLNNKLIEKHLGTSCTGRNWNTIMKINTLLQSTADNPSTTSLSEVKVKAKSNSGNVEKTTTSRKRQRKD